MKTIISEPEFYSTLCEKLQSITSAKSVTGKGRSGAIASVYTSHILGIPFIPYGENIPDKLHPVLIVDTAIKSGKTLRKAEKYYSYAKPIILWCYRQPPRVRFWYESGCRI